MAVTSKNSLIDCFQCLDCHRGVHSARFQKHNAVLFIDDQIEAWLLAHIIPIRSQGDHCFHDWLEVRPCPTMQRKQCDRATNACPNRKDTARTSTRRGSMTGVLFLLHDSDCATCECVIVHVSYLVERTQTHVPDNFQSMIFHLINLYGRTHVRAGARAGGRASGQTTAMAGEHRADGRTNGRVVGRTSRRTNERAGRTGGLTHVRMEG